jgi:hypothetical protein
MGFGVDLIDHQEIGAVNDGGVESRSWKILAVSELGFAVREFPTSNVARQHQHRVLDRSNTFCLPNHSFVVSIHFISSSLTNHAPETSYFHQPYLRGPHPLRGEASAALGATT